MAPRDGDGFVLLGEPEGIEQLGGIDFDEAVFGHVIGVLGSMAEGLDPNGMWFNHFSCQDAGFCNGSWGQVSFKVEVK